VHYLRWRWPPDRLVKARNWCGDENPICALYGVVKKFKVLVVVDVPVIESWQRTCSRINDL